MIKPSSLQPGDRIALIAPARKVNQDQVSKAVQIFKSWGLEVANGQYLFSDRHSYLAGTDEERLSDLQHAINDRSLKAIVAARGGYGCNRFIDKIDFSPLRTNPKWIVGFSDITALHLKLLRQGVMSIHGTMPIMFNRTDSDQSNEHLRRVLFGENPHIESLGKNPFNKSGRASGRLIGGNLSLVVDSLATASEPDTENSILILEEIDEYMYRFDRMIMHLKRAGKLRRLSGLAIGHMTDMKESELPFKESVENIIMNAVSEYNYPVAFGFPTGHEHPNLSWIHGSMANFNVNGHSASITTVDEISG